MQSSEGGLKNFVKFTRRLGWPATLLKNIDSGTDVFQ